VHHTRRPDRLDTKKRESSCEGSLLVRCIRTSDRKTGCVARLHRSLGSLNGSLDSVSDRGTPERPKPREATAEHPLVELPLPHTVIPPFEGGCEGLAMLNRTNLTLSASALSNGLNLGTRSLAALAGVNNDRTTLHICPSHQDVMRERMGWYVVFSIPGPRYAIPAIPVSFSPVQRRQFGVVTSQRSRASKRLAAAIPATSGK
jgi:hypothetical protein